MQDKDSYLALLVQIFLMICLLSSARKAMPQQVIRFPDKVQQLYMDEKYPEVCAYSYEFLKSKAQVPDSLKTGLHIRLALFYSWISSFDNANTFVTAWKESRPGELEFKQLPLNEQADYYSLRAVIAYNENRNDDALDTLIMAIQTRIPESKLDSAIQADGYQFRGGLEKGKMDYSKSILSYREAENINNQLGRIDPNYGIYLERVKPSLEVKPDNPQILTDINKALHYYQGISDYEKTAFAYNELGIYWRVHLNYEKSVNNFLIALRIKESNNNTAMINIAYNNLSATYNSMNRYDSVMYYMRKAIDSTRDDEFKQKALYYSNFGAIYGHLEKPDSALLCFKKAIKLLYPKEPVDNLSHNPDPKTFDPFLPIIIGNKGSALFELAKNQNDTNYLNLAVEALKISVKQFNEQRYMLSFETKAINVKDSRVYYFLALEAAAQLFRITNTPEDLSTVINFAQQSKAAVFNEYQRALKARDSLDIDPLIISLDDNLKKKKSSLNQDFFLEERLDNPNPNHLSSLTSEIIQINEKIQKISDDIEKDYPAYSKYIQVPNIVTVEEIQSALKPDEILIDYTYSAKSLVILAIATDSIRVSTIKIPSTFK